MNRETDSNVVTLYVTRHGKTILNTNHRAQGWADSPLVEKGVEVAKFRNRIKIFIYECV